MPDRKAERYILMAVSLSAVFFFWHFISRQGNLAKLMPSPIDVFKFLLRMTHETIGKKYTIFGHIMWSMSRVMVGYALSSVVGISLGLIMGWSKTGQAIIRPFYLMLRPIPPIAWIPLAILWLGIDESSKYFIIFMGSVLIITTNTADGVRSVDKNLLGAARRLGARENQLFTKIVLPSATPQIFAGLQVALGVAWATMVAAEMVRSSEGVGWVIIMGQESINMNQIFAGIVVIGVVGLILVSLMRGVEARLCAWNIRGK